MWGHLCNRSLQICIPHITSQLLTIIWNFVIFTFGIRDFFNWKKRNTNQNKKFLKNNPSQKKWSKQKENLNLKEPSNFSANQWVKNIREHMKLTSYISRLHYKKVALFILDCFSWGRTLAFQSCYKHQKSKAIAHFEVNLTIHHSTKSLFRQIQKI